MTNFLHEAASIIRDLAIIVAALIALSAFLLSLRTRIDTSEGRVVIWRLPLFRHVTVAGQTITLAENAIANVSDENAKDSAWFHVPVIIDRSRDPITLPASSARRKIRSDRVHLHLRYEYNFHEMEDSKKYLLDRNLDCPHIYIQSAENQTSSPGSFVQLNQAEAGRLRDAMVGGWGSNLWS